MALDLTQARTRLEEAARTYTINTKAETVRALCAAAVVYADSRAAEVKKAERAKGGTGVLVPFGRDKGKDLAEVESKSLHWLMKVAEEALENPEKERWREKNEELYATAEQELKQRGDL
jgi:hypothetical protein